jgi:DNA-binding response OmpR family regulator
MTLAQTNGNFRVLVVDDEEEFVATLVKRLARRGVACESAFTGAQAIAALQAGNFDVMLLDMKLPDADGKDVLREAKRLKPEIQVVILTGHISAQDGLEGRGSGAHDYLMKPVEFESLLESLQKAHEKAMRAPKG